MVTIRIFLMFFFICLLPQNFYTMSSTTTSTQQTPFSSDIHFYVRKQSTSTKPTENKNEPYVTQGALVVQESLRKVSSSPALITKTK